MDKVVLSEGINDIRFLSALHREYRRDKKFDIFDNQNEETSETKRIIQHEVDTNFEYLYKCEGGRPNLCQIFSDISVHLSGRDIELYVLVDLDGDSVDDLYNEMGKYLTSDYGNKVKLVENSKSSNEDFCILDCTLEIISGSDKQIDIFAFHNSLEEVTGIYKGEERASKREKIERYIQNCPNIIEDITSILY